MVWAFPGSWHLQARLHTINSLFPQHTFPKELLSHPRAAVAADTQIHTQFHPFSSSSVKSSLTNPCGAVSPHSLSTAHSQLSNQANKVGFGVPVFQLAKSMCSDSTGSRMEQSPSHMNQTLCPQAVPKPEFSPKSCSDHWGSATSLQRLCSIQKAPAKSIPTPDKLFSIFASTSHPSGLKESSQLSPRFPAEPPGRGDGGSRDFSPSAGPQHTSSLSAALTGIPRAAKVGLGKQRGIRAGTGCTLYPGSTGKAGASPNCRS